MNITCHQKTTNQRKQFNTTLYQNTFRKVFKATVFSDIMTINKILGEIAVKVTVISSKNNVRTRVPIRRYRIAFYAAKNGKCESKRILVCKNVKKFETS